MLSESEESKDYKLLLFKRKVLLANCDKILRDARHIAAKNNYRQDEVFRHILLTNIVIGSLLLDQIQE